VFFLHAEHCCTVKSKPLVYGWQTPSSVCSSNNFYSDLYQRRLVPKSASIHTESFCRNFLHCQECSNWKSHFQYLFCVYFISSIDTQHTNLIIIHSLYETYITGKSCLSTCPSIYYSVKQLNWFSLKFCIVSKGIKVVHAFVKWKPYIVRKGKVSLHAIMAYETLRYISI
jgi:hypothetical protein